jgi:hypothetical protein
MRRDPYGLRQRDAAIGLRIESLSSLRRTVGLAASCDITERQWRVIESQLQILTSRLLARLKTGARRFLPYSHEVEAARRLNALFGEVELELAHAYTFFDTYMDVLSQRQSADLGKLLTGCDVLAWDAINRDHPALSIVEPPLVYCDRGFGASILREVIPRPGVAGNPLPLIQIPYSRLKEKYNLTSIIHEVGHEAMVRLDLTASMSRLLKTALSKTGAPTSLGDYFALWITEIGPDLWTFCATGQAQAAGVRDVLSLPPSQVFRVSAWDPHPPPFVRVLLAFEWCRQVWGPGVWDEWEQSWRKLYPLQAISPRNRQLIRRAVAFLPLISRELLRHPFAALNGRTLPDLFNLSALEPRRISQIAATSATGTLDLVGVAPCLQLAVFRTIRDQGRLSEQQIDSVMTKWLTSLGATQRSDIERRV